MPSIGSCAWASARMLDHKLPGWHKYIDIDRLDISDSCNCIIGQLMDWMERSDVLYCGMTGIDIHMLEHSFCIARTRTFWVREIQCRRGADLVQTALEDRALCPVPESEPKVIPIQPATDLGSRESCPLARNMQ